METVDTLIKAINKEIINPVIIAAFAGTLAYFIFGVVKFIAEKQNGKDDGNGKRHMLWGLIGMFIMASVFGIMQFIVNTLSLGFDVKNPSTQTLPTDQTQNQQPIGTERDIDIPGPSGVNTGGTFNNTGVDQVPPPGQNQTGTDINDVPPPTGGSNPALPTNQQQPPADPNDAPGVPPPTGGGIFNQFGGN